ncbi:MAG: ABC transporter ATP-binding protein [Candidatus Hodarchaeota archaeon]
MQVENVVSGYGKTMIIHDISLQVHRREIVSIIGPNGSGKSTLIKTIFGLLPAVKGKITFEGMDITNLRSDRILKEGIGYVPQMNNVFPTLSVRENLEMGAYSRTDPWEKDLDLIERVFPALLKLKNEKARNLSGGEKQMLALCRALLTRPKLLLLDEPTAALAPVLVDEILNVLVDLRDFMKTSMLVVEQNARKSLAVSDRGYVLVMGKKVHEGFSDALVDIDEIRRLYLGE